MAEVMTEGEIPGAVHDAEFSTDLTPSGESPQAIRACDGFIAGYNTSSPEKKNKYDIKRLRRTATMSSSAFELQALGPFNPQGDGEAADLC